jgi:PIN domain nuclease of toxin-antitoxin system
VKLLKDPENRLFVSWLSLFEIRVKAAAGKLRFFPNTPDVLAEMGVELIPMDFDFLKQYKIHGYDNKDPFDNALITTAVNSKLVLLSSDRAILAMSPSVVRTISA